MSFSVNSAEHIMWKAQILPPPRPLQKNVPFLLGLGQENYFRNRNELYKAVPWPSDNLTSSQ